MERVRAGEQRQKELEEAKRAAIEKLQAVSAQQRREQLRQQQEQEQLRREQLHLQVGHNRQQSCESGRLLSGSGFYKIKIIYLKSFFL